MDNFTKSSILVFQEIKNQRILIDGSFDLKGNKRHGFLIRDKGNESLPITLETIFMWGSFLGGSIGDEGTGVTVDQNGNVYVIGMSMSPDFPLVNPYQGTYHDMWDLFVTKISSSGDSILYSTYLGGSQVERSMDIAVDDMGCAYITGTTMSPDYPTTSNAFDVSYNGSGISSGDVFVTKLSASGNSLIYSTFIGGSNADRGCDIILDEYYCAYVTGFTYSQVFPLQSPLFYVLNGSSDAFISKVSANGRSLSFSTYFGGNGGDTGCWRNSRQERARACR